MNHPLLLIHYLLICLLNLAAIFQTNTVIAGNEAVLNFPESLLFKLEINSDVEIDRVTLFYSSDGCSCQSAFARQDLEFQPAGDLQLEWEWDFSRDSTIPPGTVVEWQWEITDIRGNLTLTELKSLVIQDQRNDWQQYAENGITVQWLVGNDGFGEHVNHIAQEKLAYISGTMGIEIDGDIWITIYPSSDELREAVQFSTDWVGGVAFPDHNAVIVAALPGQEDWLNRVIAHELAHLVLEAYTFNCAGNWLPNWFTEGFAENVEGRLDENETDLILAASEDGNLPGLRSLVGSFSYNPAEADLHYIVSKAVIEYLILEHGTQKMAELLDHLKAGQMIDAAMEHVYGFDTDGLEAAWRKRYGFDPVVDYSSPEIAPPADTPIPTLALYTSFVQPTATATSAAAPAESDHTAQPVLTQLTGLEGPTAIPVENPVPTMEKPKTDTAWIIPGVVLIISMVAGLFIYFQRRICT